MESIKNVRKINKNIYLFLIINLIASFSMGIFNMFVGIYLKEVGYQEQFVGNILSINTFAIAIASIPSAYLIEKIGRKKSFTLGFVCISIGSSFLVIFKNPIIIILMSIINGFGMSIKSTAEGMYIVENTCEEQRVSVFSTNFVISNVGMMSASFLGGVLSSYMGNYFSPKTAIMYIFIMSSILSLIALIPIFFMKEPKKLKSRNFKDCIKGYISILNKNVISFMIYNSLIGIGAGMIVPFFSVYLKYSMNISDGIVGSILSISQFGCIVGGMIIPFISARLGKQRSIIMCQLISIPFLLSIAFPQGIFIITVSFFMRNGLMNMAMPLIQNLSMEMIEDKDRTNMSSLMSLSGNISRAIGIAIGGFLMQNVSYTAPYYFTVLFYIIAVSLFVYIYKQGAKIKKESLCINLINKD
ncbi:MFS transporter [Romboutsia sedimentorum]|uniref:MFS transporter n=1 Tax=Romboutsia sedimentorum TaxID=1368474 RepID=A0ABT7EDI5_9FIRM|nr:MFS transporter [Romboutsia sedimentorum]MDK2564978.1 MFS transporter [Romboutsia sedimentorum]